MKHKAYLNGADYCGKKYLEEFIATPYDNIIIRDYLPSRYDYRVSDPRPSPNGQSDDIWLANLIYQRINIYLDVSGNINELKCG